MLLTVYNLHSDPNSLIEFVLPQIHDSGPLKSDHCKKTIDMDASAIAHHIPVKGLQH